jgi:leucyl-tRNA synthetase
LAAPGTPVPASLPPALDKLRRAVHRGIATITDHLDKFRFNGGVARIRELTNQLEALSADAGPAAGIVLREGIEAAVRLVGPVMPHLAEEMWQALGHRTSLLDEAWPVADAALTIDETVTIAVQVNGKLRGTIELPRDAGAGAAEQAALGVPSVHQALDGRTPRKIIVVPNRIVNVVL